MLHFKQLPETTLDEIRPCRFDRIIEKHEGPEHWSFMIEIYDLEFIEIDKRAVLLPVDQKHHKNITILRSIVDKDETSLTVFLKDTTYVAEPEHDNFDAGFVAICDKIPGEEFFIAVLYHEWFIIEEQILRSKKYA